MEPAFLPMQVKKKDSLPASIIASIKNRRKRVETWRAGPKPRNDGTLIASYNVHKCVGTDRRFDPNARAVSSMRSMPM